MGLYQMLQQLERRGLVGRWLDGVKERAGEAVGARTMIPCNKRSHATSIIPEQVLRGRTRCLGCKGSLGSGTNVEWGPSSTGVTTTVFNF